jgi:hypothetical protein
MSHLQEITQAVNALTRVSKPSMWLAENYIGGGRSSLTFLDVKVPDVRRRYKEGFSFSAAPAKTQWRIWDEVWRQSSSFEAMNFSLYWAESRRGKDLLAYLPLLLRWQKRVDNWAHSDGLSSLYAYALEETPSLWDQYGQWARSRNSWDNRQSVVGLYYYARGRKQPPPFARALALIEAQLGHEDYYVQKGVGWALRESHNAYPAPTRAFLKEKAAVLSPHAWQAATEKLPADFKARLLGQRRQGREGKSRASRRET